MSGRAFAPCLSRFRRDHYGRALSDCPGPGGDRRHCQGIVAVSTQSSRHTPPARIQGMPSAEEAAAFVQERKALVGKLTVEYEADHDKQLMSTLAQFPPGEFNMANIDRALDMRAEVDQKWSQIGIENRLFAGAYLLQQKWSDMGVVRPYRRETRRLSENGSDDASKDPCIRDHSSHARIWSGSHDSEHQLVSRLDPKSDRAQQLGSLRQVTCPSIVCLLMDVSSGSSVLEGRVKIYSNEMLYEDEISTGDLSM